MTVVRLAFMPKAKRAAQEEAAGQEKVLHHLFPEEMLEMREMPGPPTIQ